MVRRPTYINSVVPTTTLPHYHAATASRIRGDVEVRSIYGVSRINREEEALTRRREGRSADDYDYNCDYDYDNYYYN